MLYSSKFGMVFPLVTKYLLSCLFNSLLDKIRVMQLITLLFLSQPQSMNGVDSFGGLGATLVDSLDTLFIMGLDSQFRRASE